MVKSIIVGGLVALSLTFSGSAGAMSSEHKPFDQKELSQFIKDYDQLTQWKPKEGQFVGNLKNQWVMAGMQYNPDFAATLTEKGWEKERFFYLLNHVQQGLSQERYRRQQQQAEEQMNKHMAEMAERMAARQAAYEKQLQEQAEQAEAWVADQLAAQKKQVQDNPYMHPLQKQRILDFLNQASQESKRISDPQLSFEKFREQAEAQRQAWEASLRQSIMDNKHIPEEQKKIILAGMDKANQPIVESKPEPMPSQEQMMARMQEQRQTWIAQQVEQIQKNPGYSDENKEKIIARLNSFAKQMEAGVHQKPASIIPEEEAALIQKNMDALMAVLHGNQ
ncbi:MAG: hypothetical protein HQL67_00120 [Magnetococcales bacterium]|nr:hypothetical protein [Magnetococcales bacterium]